jgi:DNA-binding transcriptional MerR regulator
MSRKLSLPIEESNDSSQKSDKLRMIQHMRNQYMNSKKVDEIYQKEKQQFLQNRSNKTEEPYLKSASNSLRPPSSSSSSSGNSTIDHQTDQLLQQLTHKLTHHIQENIRKEQMNSQLQEKEVCQTILSRIDDFVTSELSSFLCPICFEIMAPPSRLPMLLFPCGHTFCQSCLDQHFQKRNNGKDQENQGKEKIPSNKTCPYCR